MLRERMTHQQELDNANARVIERRKEVHQRLTQLVKRPTQEWNMRDREEIHLLVQRLLVLYS